MALRHTDCVANFVAVPPSCRPGRTARDRLSAWSGRPLGQTDSVRFASRAACAPDRRRSWKGRRNGRRQSPDSDPATESRREPVLGLS